jgi:hypothetical protein
MQLWINQIKNAYPYIANKDIDMVLKINELEPNIEYVFANWKPRPYNVRFESDIEKLFWPIQK